MTTSTGRFVWFEYVSNNAGKAQGFFGELFGWTTKTVPMPDGNYTMIAAPDGKTIGGYFAPPPGATSGAWCCGWPAKIRAGATVVSTASSPVLVARAVG